MDLPRVLVIGCESTGKHELLCSVLGRRSLQKGGASYPWRLDTKYYTADVQLEVQRIAWSDAGSAPPAAAGPGPASAYEAVLLVFDAGRKESFAALQCWWAGWEGGDDVSVKLAVAAKADWLAGDGTSGGASRPSWLAEAQAWCAEELIEYVESSILVDGAVPASGSSGGNAAADQHRQQQQLEEEQEHGRPAAEDEEPSGAARIVEALQANMWPDMVMKERGGGGGGSAHDGGPAAAAVAPTAPAAAAGVGQERQHAGAAGAAAPAPDTDFGSFLQAGELGGLLAGAGAANGTRGVEDAEEEAEAARLEQLFSRIARTRDQLQQLPDAERRAAAAAMVMQLMGALGLEEEESGGEGGSTSSEEDEEEAAPPPRPRAS